MATHTKLWLVCFLCLCELPPTCGRISWVTEWPPLDEFCQRLVNSNNISIEVRPGAGFDCPKVPDVGLGCVDDLNWKDGEAGKRLGCDFVKGKPEKRCFTRFSSEADGYVSARDACPVTCHSCQDSIIIGAGVGGTGTRSLALAVKKLGYRHTCHRSKDTVEAILDAAALGNFVTPFKRADAWFDNPIPALLRPLICSFPNYKIIQTVRSDNLGYIFQTKDHVTCSKEGPTNKLGKTAPHHTMVRCLTYGSLCPPMSVQQRVHAQLDEFITTHVPPERLLKMDMAEFNWGALAHFLGKKVPDSKAGSPSFPHSEQFFCEKRSPRVGESPLSSQFSHASLESIHRKELHCNSTDPPPGASIGCAMHWTPTFTPYLNTSFKVIAVTNLKHTSTAAIVSWVEYNHVLGLEHLVVIDNNCEAKYIKSTAIALEPYVRSGFVTHITRFQCVSLNNSYSARSMRVYTLANTKSIASRLDDSTIIFELDDDEYVVLGNPSATLWSLADSFRLNQICATQLAWRVYGDNGHYCQPQTIISNFTRRAPMLHEVSKVTEIRDHVVNAKINHLAEPFNKGKLLAQWGQMLKCRHMRDGRLEEVRASEHYCPLSCSDRKKRNCGETEPYLNPMGIRKQLNEPEVTTASSTRQPASSISCAGLNGMLGYHEGRSPGLLEGGIWINHYMFQSSEHWEEKKIRGRTNTQKSRQGGISPFYSKVNDEEGLDAFAQRLRNIKSEKLRSCLVDMFMIED